MLGDKWDFHAQNSHEDYIDEIPRKHALERLRERIEAGEDVYVILGISRENKYYVDKLVAGLCPISYGLYGRIMNLDEEDVFDV